MSNLHNENAIYISDAVAYSAAGYKPLEIFSAIETQLITAVDSDLKSVNQYELDLTVVEIAAVKSYAQQQRIRHLVANFLHTIQPMIDDSYTVHNTQVCLHLPDKTRSRSLYLNETILMPQLCAAESPLREFEFHILEASHSLLDAANYLQQRPNIQTLLYISIDSLINLETARTAQVQALGEAAVLLVLKRQSDNSLLTLSAPATSNDVATQSLQEYAILTNSVQAQINCHTQTNASIDRDYQLEQTYLSQRYSELPSSQRVQKVELCDSIGDVGVSNFSMGVMYALGRQQFKAGNETLLLTDHRQANPQILIARNKA